MSDLVLLVQLQARVATFLAGLTSSQLVALVEGRALLTVSDGKAAVARPQPEAVQAAPAPRPRTADPADGFDAAAIVSKLLACETVDQATELLSKNKVSATNMKLLAKALNIQPARSKDETATRILNLTIIARGKHAALRQG